MLISTPSPPFGLQATSAVSSASSALTAVAASASASDAATLNSITGSINATYVSINAAIGTSSGANASGLLGAAGYRAVNDVYVGFKVATCCTMVDQVRAAAVFLAASAAWLQPVIRSCLLSWVRSAAVVSSIMTRLVLQGTALLVSTRSNSSSLRTCAAMSSLRSPHSTPCYVLWLPQVLGHWAALTALGWLVMLTCMFAISMLRRLDQLPQGGTCCACRCDRWVALAWHGNRQVKARQLTHSSSIC